MKKGIVKVLVVLIIVAVLVVAGVIGFNSFFSSDEQTTKLGFEDIGEFATQSAYCTEVGVIKDSKKLFDVDIPFTKSTNIYSYGVEVKAGYDFGEIKWNVDETDKVIKVTLPEVKTLSKDIDTDSFKEYLEKESIFNPITMEEQNDQFKKLEDNAEKDAIANGLYENARTNAETLLTAFFGEAYDLGEYEIVFIDK